RSLAGELRVALFAKGGHALDQIGRRRGEGLEVRLELEGARQIGFERCVQQSLRESEGTRRSVGQRVCYGDRVGQQPVGIVDAAVCEAEVDRLRASGALTE